jgi:hypothetical protein
VEATLQTSIARIEESLRNLLEELPPSEKPNIPPLDPSLRIDCMNGDDAEYLIDKWKWQYRGAFGGSSPSWIYPAHVDGTLVVLQGACRDSVLLRANSDVIQSSEIAERVESLKRSLKGIRVEEAAGPRISFISEVSLSGGITVREFKARIQQFARGVSPHVKKL